MNSCLSEDELSVLKRIVEHGPLPGFVFSDAKERQIKDRLVFKQLCASIVMRGVENNIACTAAGMIHYKHVFGTETLSKMARGARPS